MRNKTIALSATVSFCMSVLAAWGAAFDDGVKLFGQRNYKAAAVKFEQAVKNSPNDSNACYYRALTYQCLGDRAKASTYYKQILQRFPYSTAAQYAQQALTPVERPSRAKSTRSGSGSSFGADPEQTRIYYTKQGEWAMVDADVNNRSTRMMFDTGAEGCLFSVDQLRQLGITPPKGPPTGTTSGIGSKEPVKAWDLNIDLKVGQIIRKNFPVQVLETYTLPPLLGQSFFSDFEYTIDDSSSSILLSKRGSGNMPLVASVSNVPFTNEGKEMVVEVEINGKKCAMFFDTGADTISFTQNQAKAAGISIPEDAEETTSSGAAGSTPSRSFSVRRMRMGPIEKSDITISVIEKGGMPKPLLGQPFFAGWQYTIDNRNKVIKFLRR